MGKILMDRMLDAQEVAELLAIAKSTAYKRIKKFNLERMRKGFEIESGKIPLSVIIKKYGLNKGH